ncbi:MAG: glycosyltransferase family 4 protein [Bacteroidales bacterium]|nr:glycosyltransferase family 4 protein [Bacteroidales bacterium]
MRIAVNTRLLIKDKLEGIGWFTVETFKRIISQHPEVDFVFLFDRGYNPEFIFSDNVIPVSLPPQARHPVLYYTWFNLSIPWALKKYKADMFLSPDGYISLNTSVPQLTVFHDLNFEHYPDDLPFIEQKYYRYFFPKFAQKAKRIATVSEFSKKDIIHQYDVAPEKIDVVYNGANPSFKPATEDIIHSVQQKYTGGQPYFLFIGALHPRKNLVNLFKAFEQFKKSTDHPHKLLIAGNKKWWTRDIQKTYEALRCKEDIIFAGRVSMEELVDIMGSAQALTYVSYFEGFGIPIVEAFYAHTPVITSNITSMPEVAGDAALIVDPFSVAAIADSMKKIAGNASLRETLIEKGKAQANNFSWQQTADKMWKSIEKTYNS